MKDKNINRKIGAAGVMRVKAELLARGFDVAEPDVDCGVDLIAWDHRKINRIQVKATVQKTSDTGSHFHVTRVVHKQAKSRSSYDPREIDFIICVSIPLNKFWIIPPKNALGKAKLYMSVGNQYHDKWIFLSQSGREISGDKLESARELRMKLWELKKLNKKLLDSIRRLELKDKISWHKICNYYRYIRKDLTQHGAMNVEKYGTIYDQEEWEKNHFKEDVIYFQRNLESLEKLYNNPFQCRSGVQGDPATGCPPESVFTP
jgi:hypothetical protein